MGKKKTPKAKQASTASTNASEAPVDSQSTDNRPAQPGPQDEAMPDQPAATAEDAFEGTLQQQAGHSEATEPDALAAALQEIQHLKSQLTERDAEIDKLRGQLQQLQQTSAAAQPMTPAEVPQLAEFTARWEALRAKQAEADAKQKNFTDALATLKHCVADIVQLASNAGKSMQSKENQPPPEEEAAPVN